MIPTILSVVATVLVAGAFAFRRRWTQVLAASAVWSFVCFLILFHTGSVARQVLRPGPPVEMGADSFYVGIQVFQRALFEHDVALIYLSLLLVINLFSFRPDKR